MDVVRGTFGAVEVEPGDATAAADALDAGIVVGSAFSNGYAIRVDFTSAGLAAINDAGTTQLRIAFPGIGGGTGLHDVGFADGDATAPVGAALPDLSDYMGSAAPFLDVAYEAPTDVVRAGATQGIRLSRGSENPFFATATLVMRLPESAHVRLSIYDVRGRRVRTLVDAVQPAGATVVGWGGVDERGVRVPPGVYWARMTTGEHVRTQRLVRLGR